MNSNILKKKAYLLHWMYDFIEDDDEPAYQKEDVQECDDIVTAFIHNIDTSIQKSDYTWVLKQVETFVKTLNALNIKHENQLIETNQREDLCDLVELVVLHTGHPYKADITEPWRKW